MPSKRIALSRLVVSFAVLTLVLAMVGACGGDDDSPETDKPTTEESTPAEPMGELLTIDSTLGELLDNPDTYAILEKHLPQEFLTDPRLGNARGLALPQFAPMTEGLVTDEMLAAADEELKELGAYSATIAATTAPKGESKLTGEPVKIGILAPWSGPSGVVGLITDNVVEAIEFLVEERGGILGGRPVEFERYDTESDVARAQAGWVKLDSDKSIVAVVIGGATPAEMDMGMAESLELELPFFTLSENPEIQDYPYTVRSGNVVGAKRASVCANVMLETFDPKTAGYLADNTDDSRHIITEVKRILDDAGVDNVSEQYIPAGTTDLNPALTKIRRADPDVLFAHSAGATVFQAMYQQITEQGGWGDIKVIGMAAAAGVEGVRRQPGAEGAYYWGLWSPGLSFPGAETFEQAWQAVHGSDITPADVQMYMCVMTAVEAIDQAGADRDDIATLIRSGTFEWESPAGPMLFGTDGESSIPGYVILIKDGEPVPVTP